MAREQSTLLPGSRMYLQLALPIPRQSCAFNSKWRTRPKRFISHGVSTTRHGHSKRLGYSTTTYSTRLPVNNALRFIVSSPTIMPRRFIAKPPRHVCFDLVVGRSTQMMMMCLCRACHTSCGLPDPDLNLSMTPLPGN
jgi:hypothetical protein